MRVWNLALGTYRVTSITGMAWNDPNSVTAAIASRAQHSIYCLRMVTSRRRSRTNIAEITR